MHGNQRLRIVVHELRGAPDIAYHSQVVKRHEDAVGANERKPEMDFAERLVQHAPTHLREPEVSPRKDAKDGSNAHHQMEVSDYEIRGVQINIDRGLGQKETADASTHKHRDESERK